MFSPSNGSDAMTSVDRRRSGGSEPRGQRVREPDPGQVSHPGHVPVWPNQDRRGGGHRTEREPSLDEVVDREGQHENRAHHGEAR